MSKVSLEEFARIVAEELPWARETGFAAESLGDGEAVCRLPFRPEFLRPGDTVSGPTMMMLADATMYAVVLSALGPLKLAVTPPGRGTSAKAARNSAAALPISRPSRLPEMTPVRFWPIRRISLGPSVSCTSATDLRYIGTPSI